MNEDNFESVQLEEIEHRVTERVKNRFMLSFFVLTVSGILFLFGKIYFYIFHLPFHYEDSDSVVYEFRVGSQNRPTTISLKFDPSNTSYFFRTNLVFERSEGNLDREWYIPMRAIISRAIYNGTRTIIASEEHQSAVYFKKSYNKSEVVAFPAFIEQHTNFLEYNMSIRTATEYLSDVIIVHQYNTTSFEPIILFKQRVKKISLSFFFIIAIQFFFCRKTYTSFLAMILATSCVLYSNPFVKDPFLSFIFYCIYESCFRCIVPLLLIVKIRQFRRSYFQFTLFFFLLGLVYFIFNYQSLTFDCNQSNEFDPILSSNASLSLTIVITSFYYVCPSLFFALTIPFTSGYTRLRTVICFVIYIFASYISLRLTYIILCDFTFFNLNHDQTRIYSNFISMLTAFFISQIFTLPYFPHESKSKSKPTSQN